MTDLPARALGGPCPHLVHFVNSVQTIIPARPEASALPFFARLRVLTRSLPLISPYRAAKTQSPAQLPQVAWVAGGLLKRFGEFLERAAANRGAV